MKTYEQARKRLPECCIAAVEACEDDKTIAPIQNVIDGVQGELDLYLEGNENITISEAAECRKFLKWIKRK